MLTDDRASLEGERELLPCTDTEGLWTCTGRWHRFNDGKRSWAVPCPLEELRYPLSAEVWSRRLNAFREELGIRVLQARNADRDGEWTPSRLLEHLRAALARTPEPSARGKPWVDAVLDPDARPSPLLAALQYYADEINWRMSSSGITPALDDKGYRAREALNDATLPPPAVLAERERKGWLVEVPQLFRKSDTPTYWEGPGDLWTDDHERAVRFARKIDADRVRKWLYREKATWTEDCTRSVEHSWHGGPNEDS